MDVDSQGDTAGADLRFRVPAVAERLHQLRRALKAWAVRLGLGADTVADLVLGAYEAMANVVEHAYRDRLVGLLDLHAHADPTRRTVVITVTDFGCWQPPPDGPTPRGRGLRLIQSLAKQSKVSPSQHGTTVAMTYQMA